MSLLGGSLQFLSNLLFPRYCVSCQKEGEWLCQNCRDKVVLIKTRACFNCNKLSDKGLCQTCSRKFPFRAAYSATYYSDPIIKSLIQRYKYNGTYELTPIFTDMVHQTLETVSFSKDSIITSVPLHYSRYCERGYNQSALFAQSLSQKLNFPYKELLKRQRATTSQAALTRQQRLTNLEQAFTPLAPQEICGRHILLIDDVITTGATVSECATTLKTAGAKSVTILTIAHG